MTRAERQMIAIRSLAGVGIASVCLALAGLTHTIQGPIPSALGWQPEVGANIIAGAGTMAALLFAVVQWAASHFSQQSLHMLETAKDGIRRAHDVISNEQPNRSFAVVNAARIILRSEEIAGNLTDKDHRRAWLLFREEWRIRFVKYLSADLPYYFGVGEWREAQQVIVTPELVGDLAKRSFTNRELEVEGLSASSEDNASISEGALKAVFDFVTAFDRGDDPLDKVPDFTDADKDRMMWNDHIGLLAYLKINESYSTAGGRAHKRSRPATEYKED